MSVTDNRVSATKTTETTLVNAPSKLRRLDESSASGANKIVVEVVETKSAVDSLTLGFDLTPEALWKYASRASDFTRSKEIKIEDESIEAIKRASAVVEDIVANKRQTYGINTGFGFFANRVVSPEDLQRLQYNIIRSHCCGMEEILPRDLTLCMWLVNLNKLCQGHSGVRYQTIRSVLSHLKRGILADVPSRGSVGASGDLAPLAHATRATIGEGNCSWPNRQGAIVRGSAKDALAYWELKPVEYGPKEGLSLVNGTALSTALAIKAYNVGSKLLRWANLAAALTTDALGASRSPFQSYTLRAHRHATTYSCGSQMREWLGERSDISDQHKEKSWIQDPYCVRCAPVVHGSVALALEQAREVLVDEINAATDNPLVFPEEGGIVANCGHFHAIYPARVSDSLASAFATLACISERRTNQLMRAERGHLPTFLVREGGVNSGFMMIQVTAAALASEAKTLTFPASADSIPTNVQKEDHVSMGPNAGYKALRVLELVRDVIAIELVCAAQAVDLLKPLRPAEKLEPVCERIRELVPFFDEDRSIAEDVAAVARDFTDGGFDRFIAG